MPRKTKEIVYDCSFDNKSKKTFKTNQEAVVRRSSSSFKGLKKKTGAQAPKKNNKTTPASKSRLLYQGKSAADLSDQTEKCFNIGGKLYKVVKVKKSNGSGNFYRFGVAGKSSCPQNQK